MENRMKQTSSDKMVVASDVHQGDNKNVPDIAPATEQIPVETQG